MSKEACVYMYYCVVLSHLSTTSPPFATGISCMFFFFFLAGGGVQPQPLSLLSSRSWT